MKIFLNVIIVIFISLQCTQSFAKVSPKPLSIAPPNNDSTYLFFPSSHYTPFGYLDNPYHSMIFNRSGLIRSIPPLGFGYWRTDFKGSYAEGPRDHQNYLSLLQIGLTIDGHSFASTEDFSNARIELYSAYHSKNIFSYDFNYANIKVSIKYFLFRENSLVCIVDLHNSGRHDKNVIVNGTHIYKIGNVKWWGSNGIVSNYSAQTDAIISKIWAYGDCFIFGSDQNCVAYASTQSESQWKHWLKLGIESSIKSTMLIGKGPMYALLKYNINVPAKSSRSLFLSLSRGKNEEMVKKEFLKAKANAISAFNNKINEDNKFWSHAVMLSGDWPVTWEHGWVYDFETLRMNVRNPIGIYKHPWDGMQVSSPRVVLGETCMDMMALSYADPNLAKKVLYGTFADAIAPNIPCSREDGSVNMVSADGSECGTAPMWGYPFHIIQSIFASTGDTVWIDSLYPYLKSYIEWWLKYRTDKDGWLHCNNSWESGQDGSKRFIVAENNEGAVADFVRTVDVEASMAEAMVIMEKFANILGKKQDQKNWKMLSKQRIKNTRAMFIDNWFRDIDARTNKPIILTGYYDVAMLAPLTCGIANEEQTKALKAKFKYFQRGTNSQTQWPPQIFTLCEAAWNGETRDIAADILASIADRVYGRTDSRKIMYYNSTFSYRIPGVANEFWPVKEIPAGGENYGWGATLPMNILRSIVGFRESNNLHATEFFLAPMLPYNFMQPNNKYRVDNLFYRDVKFNLLYEVKGSNHLVITLEYKTQTPLSVTVSKREGMKVITQHRINSGQQISFNARNGDIFIVKFN